MSETEAKKEKSIPQAPRPRIRSTSYARTTVIRSNDYTLGYQDKGRKIWTKHQRFQSRKAAKRAVKSMYGSRGLVTESLLVLTTNPGRVSSV